MKEEITKFIDKIISEIINELNGISSDNYGNICKIWYDFANNHEQIKNYNLIFYDCRAKNHKNFITEKDDNGNNILYNENFISTEDRNNIIEILMNNNNLFEELLKLYENIL